MSLGYISSAFALNTEPDAMTDTVLDDTIGDGSNGIGERDLFQDELTADLTDEELQLEEGQCPFCSYKSKARDKMLGLRKHVENKHADRFEREPPSLPDFFDAEEPPTETPEEKEINRHQVREELEHSIRELHANFDLGPVPADIHHLSVGDLGTYRARCMMKVQTLAAKEAAFKGLQLTMALTEAGMYKFAKVDIRGAAMDIEQPAVKGEVLDIIAQMIAVGDLNIATLTPDVRLALLLAGVYYGRFMVNSHAGIQEDGEQ